MPHASRGRNQGSTIIEALVALVLLGVGVAAWTGTTALATRVAADAARATGAQHRARSRAERLAAGSCADVIDGRAGDERWRVVTGANGVRLVHAEAEYRGGGQQRIASYALVIAC